MQASVGQIKTGCCGFPEKNAWGTAGQLVRWQHYTCYVPDIQLLEKSFAAYDKVKMTISDLKNTVRVKFAHVKKAHMGESDETLIGSENR